jgi:hypothetical protein
MLRVAARARSGAARAEARTNRSPHEWRISHGLREVARTSAVAAAANRHCYSIVIDGAHRANPAKNGPLRESSIVSHCY